MYKRLGLDAHQVQMPEASLHGRVVYDPSAYGEGTRARKRQWALDTRQNIQNPPFASRRNANAGRTPLVVWFEPGDRDSRFVGLEDPRRPYFMRRFKTGPAYFLSKAVRGITRDETGAVLPFCKVLVFRTSDNVLIAQTVSDASGAYVVTVPS